VASFSTRIDDQSDEAFAYSVGLFWQPVRFYRWRTPPLRLGAVWSRGAKFEVPEDVLDAQGDPIPGESPTFTLKVPDRYGVGLSYALERGRGNSNRFVYALDAVHVKYEDLLEGFQTGLNPFTRQGRTVGGGLQPDIHFTADNGIEVRTGLEASRNLGRYWRGSLRVGYARLPDNRIYAETVEAQDPALEAALLDLFPQGEDQDAFSGGFALAFIRGRVNWRLDAAYMAADEQDQAVVSYLLRF
jgi:hypothetical protein